MLKMIFGRSGSGKTEYVFNQISSLVKDGKNNILLITPEQYSLIAERRLLTELGSAGITAVENGSFSRISNEVKRIYGDDTLPLLSKGSKAVLMLQAIEEAKEDLELFNKNLDSLNFVNSMISVYDEMRSCNLSADEIYNLSRPIENITLNKKMSDISLIMRRYEKIINERFLDPSDELTRLYNKIKDLGYFKDKYIFIDGFNGFVAQEYKILELIINEAKETVITLCCDKNKNENDFFSVFGYVNKSAAIIKRIAEKANVEYREEYFETNHRGKTETLKHIEKYIFSSNEKITNISDDSISVYLSSSINDECEEVSRGIRKLLRNGYKASEIAVITRDIEKYKDELGYAFKKYEIPYFFDERQPIKSQPLVVFIEYLLRCVIYSLRSDDILSLAKTGLTPLNDDEINELENYVYLWNINGSKWTKPFENSTKGFVDKIDENDLKKINEIEKSRQTLIDTILKFKNSIKGKKPLDICAQIYYTLINFEVDKRIQDYAVYLNSKGHNTLAQLQGRIWDMVMEVLDSLPAVLPDAPIDIKEFAKIFSIVITNEDLGVLPGGIDNVQFGQADRIRTDNPRAVFIIGANEGEFPQAVSSGGLLSEADRRILLDNDFKLYSYGEILSQQEKYFAYMACSAPGENLFISYLGNVGKDSAPSELITSLEAILPNIKHYSYKDIDYLDLIETRQNAFELMSKNYSVNNKFYSSLKDVFRSDDKFISVYNIAENMPAKINDSELSTKLFGYNMLVSASRIEDYFNCSFRYFCKFGLGVRPPVKTEIDALKKGTLIHYVLEMILSKYGSRALSEMPSEEIIKAVDKFITQYFEIEMGNVSNLSERFYYNFNRISNQIYNVVLHLALEFKYSDFEAKAFELDIDENGSVTPEIISLSDGGSIQIRGSIDRVDTFEKDGRKYVRVVDYKSGSKEFDLSDVMFGLNLQMFVYLFSLTEDKNAKLNGIPAGVLYMHANQKIAPFTSRKNAQNDLESTISKSFKMMGVVISDYSDETIPNAMEHDIKGNFIPVVKDKKGNLIGSLADLEELGRIHRRVNDLIAEMGINLHQGKIERNPVRNKNHKTTCDYCDYADVCANQRIINERVVVDLKPDAVKEMLIKEYGSNAAMDKTTE